MLAAGRCWGSRSNCLTLTHSSVVGDCPQVLKKPTMPGQKLASYRSGGGSRSPQVLKKFTMPGSKLAGSVTYSMLRPPKGSPEPDPPHSVDRSAKSNLDERAKRPRGAEARLIFSCGGFLMRPESTARFWNPRSLPKV